jgi:hypothetical protein
MSLSVSTTSPPRLLKPVSQAIRVDGAPFVPLSPHKGVRNAEIIYQAIKDMPDHTLIRGDFDKRSRPLIYFPERPPKKIGQLTPISAKNALYDRAEFASFMRSIVEATFKEAPTHAPQLKAAFNLRSTTLMVTKEERDFTVGDIRESLRSIAKSHSRKNLKNITSPHRTQPGRESPLQAERFRKFCQINGQMIAELCDALSVWMKGDDARNKALIAVQGMKQFLFSYRILHEKENISLVDFLQKHPISQEVCTFAKLWMALSAPDGYGRTRFSTESWSLELDRICPLILKNYRTQQVLESGKRSRQVCKSSDRSPVAATSIPANSPKAVHRPRVLKRKRIHPVSPTAGGLADSPQLASSVLIRQSSVPKLRAGQAQSSLSGKSSVGRADSVIFKRIDFSSVAKLPSTATAGDTSIPDTH